MLYVEVIYLFVGFIIIVIVIIWIYVIFIVDLCVCLVNVVELGSVWNLNVIVSIIVLVLMIVEIFLCKFGILECVDKMCLCNDFCKWFLFYNMKFLCIYKIFKYRNR